MVQYIPKIVVYIPLSGIYKQVSHNFLTQERYEKTSFSISFYNEFLFCFRTGEK